MNYRFDWTVLWTHRELLLSGLIGTIQIFLPAAALSVVGGLLVGIASNSRSEVLRDLARYYVNSFRNIPSVVILFFLCFAYRQDPYIAAVVGLSVHHSAYVAAVTEAGIRSSARFLLMTALASGFTSSRAYYYVVLPVALRIMIPPMTTQMLELLKNTSIAMTIGFIETTYAVSVVSDETYRGFETATAGTLLYALLGCALVGGMSRLEKRFQVRV